MINRLFPRRAMYSIVAAGAFVALGACDPSTTGGTTASSSTVYYDSVLWNDYYWGRPVPPRPGRPPGKPENPIERPPAKPVPPIAKPPRPTPPIHRPSRPRPVPARF